VEKKKEEGCQVESDVEEEGLHHSEKYFLV